VEIPIQSLDPEPYEFIQPIPAVVRQEGEEYVATFYDANISASGETEKEAIQNLKDMVVATYELLTGHDRENLAAGSARTRDILETFVRAVR
jgi:predicted RNase H-like HicB family nuclease